ncbi:cyclin-C-like [Glossina fuscipes fuscipes]
MSHEEFGVISNSRLIFICQSVIKSKFSYVYTQDFPYRTNHILECEFYLLENLGCCLIVYQPYRPLLQLVQDMGQEDQLLTFSWRIVNDSLRTDVCLLYPSFQIAIACLQIACVILQKDSMKQWFAELNVDLDKVQEIVRAIVNLFELWKDWKEKDEIQILLAKIPKPKPLYKKASSMRD